MKALYTLLLLTAIGLGANAATNNNAGKVLHLENKAMPSSVVYNYPTVDGGSYVVYQPQLTLDSICITRLDPTGAVAWTKKFIDANWAAEFTTTNDNALLFISQHETQGNQLIKLSVTGNIDYINGLQNYYTYGIERAENGYISFSGTTYGTIVFNELLPTGLSNVALSISATGAFSEDVFGTTVTYNANTTEVYASSGLNDRLAVMKLNAAGNTLWSKTFATGTDVLQPYKHIQLRDGNIVVGGVNKTAQRGFIVKLDSTDGNVIWANEYDLSYGSFSTTVSNETYEVKGAGFDRLVEMPNGDIVSVSSVAITDMNNYSLASISRVASNGAFVSSYYVHSQLPQLSQGAISWQKFTRIVNLNGASDGYYVGYLGAFPDTNSVGLLSLDRVQNLCGIIQGASSTSAMGLSSDDLAINVNSQGTMSYPVSSTDVEDGSIQYTTSEVCFSETQTLPTNVEEATTLEVSLLPNPAVVGKQAIVRLSDPSQVQRISIIDLSGKTLISTTDVSAENTISLGGIASGTYMVQLQGSKQTASRKLIIIE